MKEFVKLTREERETYYRVDDVTDECIADSSIHMRLTKDGEDYLFETIDDDDEIEKVAAYVENLDDEDEE